jgi:hypothetical protein
MKLLDKSETIFENLAVTLCVHSKLYCTTPYLAKLPLETIKRQETRKKLYLENPSTE